MSAVLTKLEASPQALANFCHRHHIKRLAFFGSVLRADFSGDSDVDVLVEFGEGDTPGLEFFGLADELETILGRKVDLLTPGFLSPHIKDEILAESQVQYEA